MHRGIGDFAFFRLSFFTGNRRKRGVQRNVESWNNPAPGATRVKAIYRGGPLVDSVSGRMATNTTQSEQLITKEELAQRLNLSVDGVKNLVYRRAIPVLRLGHRTIRFRWSEVEAAIERYRQDEIS